MSQSSRSDMRTNAKPCLLQAGSDCAYADHGAHAGGSYRHAVLVPKKDRQVAVTAISPDSLYGKNIVGYQGWFTCPPIDYGMGTLVSEQSGVCPDAHRGHVPGHFRTGSGRTVVRRASRIPRGGPSRCFPLPMQKTVDRHFRWMRDYGIDGASAQRFVSEVAIPERMPHWDQVLTNVMQAAERNGRVFFVEYEYPALTRCCGRSSFCRTGRESTQSSRLRAAARTCIIAASRSSESGVWDSPTGRGIPRRLLS